MFRFFALLIAFDVALAGPTITNKVSACTR
jgi:hypothetical protein